MTDYISRQDNHIIWDDNAKAAYEKGVQDTATISLQYCIQKVLPVIINQLESQFNEKLEELTPAISDGLRHGSAECGRQMSKKRKRIG